LDVYQEQTKPLIAYYASTDRLATVDGMQEIEVVHKLILEVLNSKKRVHA
jgi:adenylate kinase family enzyme